MKTKMLIIIVGILTITFSCDPVYDPNSTIGNSVETPIDTIVLGDTVWDNSALIGKWKPYNYRQTYIFEDGVIYSQYDDNEPEIWCRYTNFGHILHLERLYFIETHPSRYAYCKYSINGDTLRIEDFSMTIAAVHPPIFKDATLIKVKE